jgi:hypothetical protein
VTVNCIERISDLFSGQTSTQISKQGKHSVLIKLRMTSSDAILPILPNNALKARLNDFLAFAKQHQNDLPVRL